MNVNFMYIGIAVVIGVVLGIGYYGLSPLFITITADEALPKEAPQATSTPIMVQAGVRATVVGTAGHPASGVARLIETDGTTYVRYENFKTINGPDLYVYLAKDLEAKEFVSLGLIKATEGNVNYEVPAGVNLSEYRYALTWCKQFGVLFNYADFAKL